MSRESADLGQDGEELMAEKTETEIRYRLMDEVQQVIDALEQDDPTTRDALEKLRERLLKSGGLADPSGNPRFKR